MATREDPSIGTTAPTVNLTRLPTADASVPVGNA